MKDVSATILERSRFRRLSLPHTVLANRWLKREQNAVMQPRIALLVRNLQALGKRQFLYPRKWLGVVALLGIHR